MSCPGLSHDHKDPSIGVGPCHGKSMKEERATRFAYIFEPRDRVQAATMPIRYFCSDGACAFELLGLGLFAS